MNSSNTGQQLRYLEEVCISLHRAGFETKPPEDCQLPILWNDAPLCRITGKGSVLYRQEHVDALGAQDALQAVIDTAKMTSEYMAILETAPRLKASGLDGDYRILADFGGTVLAGTPSKHGVQFVTWVGTMTGRVWYTDTTSWRTTMPPSGISPHAPGLSKRSSFSARSRWPRFIAAVRTL